MRLIPVKVVGVWLDNMAVFEEKQAGLFRGHAGDEGLCLGEQFSQSSHRGDGIDGWLAGNAIEVLSRVAGGSSNLVDDSFRGKSKRFSDRGLNCGAQREDTIVNRQQIDYISGFAAPIRCCNFVGGEVNGMKHITKGLIWHCGKEPVIAIDDPFQLGCFTRSLHKCGVDERIAAMPSDREPMVLKQSRVDLRSFSNTILTVVKDIDVARVPGCGAIQRSASCDVAFRVPMGGKQCQNFGLNPRQRHDRLLRSVQPICAPLSFPQRAMNG